MCTGTAIGGSVLCTGLTLRHSTPEWVLQSNFRLTRANLLKAGQLRKKSRCQVAVEQPEVSAGELVEKKEQREISHFSAGDCTERGSRVKALRFAPTADAARQQRAVLTRLPLRSCVASS
jgi:hypothetical protein